MKNKFIQSAFLLVMSLAFVACGGDANKEILGHLIEGEIKGGEGSNVSLMVFEDGKETLIDSAVIIDGKFSFETKTKELREYILFFENEVPIILFLDEASETTVIKGSLPGIGENYTVSGSEFSSGIKEYLTFLNQFYAEETRLYNQLQAANPTDSNAIKPIMAQLDSISAIQRTFAVERIEKDTASPVSWMLLRELIPASGLLGFDSTDLRYFQQVYNGMKAKYPYSEYPDYIDMDIQGIKEQYAQMSGGNSAGELGVAPEINLNDYNSKPIALSSLRGKVVLVDFWASWCKPCRMENPNVVATYEKYKDKGFTVYSVSLDENRDAWMQAITADNLSWPNHVSDLKGWQSEAAAAYGVNSIPATFLLDKEGNIIAQNLRGGQLEQKLQEILK